MLSTLSFKLVMSFSRAVWGVKVVLIVFMIIQKNWEPVFIHRRWKLKQKPSKLADGCRSWIPAIARCLCHLLLTKQCAGRVSVDFAFPVPGSERGLCLCQQQQEEGEAVSVPGRVPSLWPGLLASNVRIGLGVLQGYKTPSC